MTSTATAANAAIATAVITTVPTAADMITTTTSQISITADYNTIKSSIIAFEEKEQLTKFRTYSAIVIKRYTYDDINIDVIKEMIE